MMKQIEEKYPHYYEYASFGLGETEKGENYYAKYWREIRKELDDIEKFTRMRFLVLGGDNRIHKTENDGK